MAHLEIILQEIAALAGERFHQVAPGQVDPPAIIEDTGQAVLPGAADRLGSGAGKPDHHRVL